jgi:hypothetical protein
LTPAAHRPGFFLAIKQQPRKEKAMTNSFIDYWDAVDAAMLRHFGTDTAAAGIGAGTVSEGYDYGRAPEDLAFWCGVKFSLSTIGG